MHIYRHVGTKSLEALQELLDNTLILRTSAIAQKVRHNRFKCEPGISLIAIHTFVEFKIFHKLPDLRAIKNTCFQFGLTYARKFLVMVSESSTFFVQCFDKILYKSELDAQWRK